MSARENRGFEIRRDGEKEYAKPLARALLRDARLSWGARGLFAFLWDLPAGWRTNSAHLTTMSPGGRDAVRSFLRELEQVGAIRTEVLREGRRLAGKCWVLVAPHLWAQEAPLRCAKTQKAAPAATSTDSLKTRPSENPTVEKSAPKVLPSEGFATQAAERAQNGDSESGGAAAASVAQKPNQQQASRLEDLMAPLIKNELDVVNWASLAAEFSQDVLREAIQEIVGTGQRPYCSTISKRLRKTKPAPPGGVGGASFLTNLDVFAAAKSPSTLSPETLQAMKAQVGVKSPDGLSP